MIKHSWVYVHVFHVFQVFYTRIRYQQYWFIEYIMLNYNAMQYHFITVVLWVLRAMWF